MHIYIHTYIFSYLLTYLINYLLSKAQNSVTEQLDMKQVSIRYHTTQTQDNDYKTTD